VIVDLTSSIGPALALGTASAPLAKLAVDIIRRADEHGSLPGWALPLCAAGFGMGFSFLAVWGAGSLSLETVPIAIMAGPVAAGWALGITEGQRWADRA